MPLAHAKFFEEPREFTDEQITELRSGGLLREDAPAPPVTPPVTPPSPPAPGNGKPKESNG
jgi:hypothetical protein